MLAVTAGSATASEQFNLNCEGQRRFEDRTEPVTIIIRVDLERRLWCRDECLGMREIESVSPVNLILENEIDLIVSESRPFSSYPTKKYLMLSRTEGIFAEGVLHPFNEIFSGGGRCTVAPFTGFPADPVTLF
jgi:hypothetical protein